jgi:hypothetical protein
MYRGTSSVKILLVDRDQRLRAAKPAARAIPGT